MMSVTIVLIVINVIVFLVLELLGQTESAVFMMEHGAMYPPYIQENGEYWRLFTAMFMHFGLVHLLHNMVMLGAAGQILERAVGKIKFIIIYLIAGIGGSILSYVQMLRNGEYAVSAGASGAVFGIVGALSWVVIVHKGRYETLTGKGMLAMIALCLYYGISTGNVDNWGHIGGLVMGFIMGILCMRHPLRLAHKSVNDES